MILYDFECNACGHQFEALVRGGRQPNCESCDSPDIARFMPATTTFTTIQATSRTSKAFKAGYVGDAKRPATPGKIQVGWGGSPKR